MVLITTSTGTTRLAAGPLIYAASVTLSSALLFVVQPVMAKSLLPRFGGSAGVWIACMLFFQVTLLLGYLYSFCITRFLGIKGSALTLRASRPRCTSACALTPRNRVRQKE